MIDGENDAPKEGVENGASKAGVSIFRNPFFLTAFVAAIVAAFANAYVAYINNNTMLDIETHKEGADQVIQERKEFEEQLIEERKAEFSRLLELSKLDLEPAKQKLKAFVDLGLITDQKIRAGIISATRSSTTAQPPVINNSAPQSDYATIPWDSDWVGGGHNQDEICNNGLVVLKGKEEYKGKLLSRLFASEDSRKDFLGHVQYRYHCTYRVSSN